MRDALAIPDSSGSAAPADRSSGQKPIPGYRLIEFLGRSRSGEVWRCESPDGRKRRLRLLPDLPNQDAQRARQALERICALSHPALAAANLLETESGRLILASDDFEQTVLHRCRICQAQRLPGIPRSELLGYLRKAAEGLDYLHNDARLHHLALTPYHLALAGDALLVADAGLAGVFGVTEFLLATQAARYAAPELLEGLATPACDQYSLALIYCEMLTGIHPFRGQSPRRMSKRGGERPRPALDLLSAGDRSVILRALDPDPNQRFANCGEFIESLELGDPNRLADSVHEFGELPETIDLMARPPKGSDPMQALDRLHRLLSELGGDSTAVPALDRETANPRIGLEHRCGARVYSSTARLKLEGFRLQWNAHMTHVEATSIGYRIDLPQSFWRRCSGKKQPGVEVTFRFEQPQTVNAELTEVTIELRPAHCDAEAGRRILNQVAPMIVDNARSYLQATPERRDLDRLKYDARIQVLPVFLGQQNSQAVDCIAKDISMRGIGYLTDADPETRRVFVMLSTNDGEGPSYLPAEIVRVQCRTDGYREVGARFAFGGFHAGAS